MAPIYISLAAWEVADLPTLAVVSTIILFILSVTLLALCTTCQRHSFELDHNAPVDRSASTLVRVVPLEKAGAARDNLDSATITQDERNHSMLPEDFSTGLGPNQMFSPWRSHTLERAPERMINGDISDISSPAVITSPQKGSSVYKEQSLSTLPEHDYSGYADPHDFQNPTLQSVDNKLSVLHPSDPPEHIYSSIHRSNIPARENQTDTQINTFTAMQQHSNIVAQPSAGLQENYDFNDAMYAVINKKTKVSLRQ